MVYDCEKQSIAWSTQGGHTETIFDCQFSVHDPNLLATCSFDTSIRIWDVARRSCTQTLLGATVCAGA
jgi:WD repeat-containing protein 17